MKIRIAKLVCGRKSGIAIAVVLLVLLAAYVPVFAEPRGGAPARAAVVDRSSHGSVRHEETRVVQRPAEVRREPEHPVEVRREPARPAEVRHDEIRRDVPVRHDVYVHRDVEVDVHFRHAWNDFAFGRRHDGLPLGYISLNLGGVPYFYNDGVYYQQADGGYQEVYPPVGAAIPQTPDGAIEVDAGGVAYYFAGGAFYLQQPDGTYAIAPAPMGIVVPELPPGAVQVSVNGNIAYQFNGVYYEPVFVNGVTQYETFTP
jgi:hypothetical protein